jgi:chemotaxis methyl-accepting protein methylase
VLVEQHVVPGEWPARSFDLIVFSEILYYFDDADLDRLLRLGAGALRPGGDLPSVAQADGIV